jgi:tRNA threonylcarbamoyladenosine biosynthesis protein TsaE
MDRLTKGNTVRAVLAFQLQDEAATESLGRRIASALAPGCVIHLSGDLGTGKTTLVRACLRALGQEGRVKSPTYTLVEPYELSSLCLYHFDFYRLKDPQEWLDAGFRDYFNDQAVCLVEWPEKAGDLLPPADLHIALSYTGENSREATLSAQTEPGARLLRSISNDAASPSAP